MFQLGSRNKLCSNYVVGTNVPATQQDVPDCLNISICPDAQLVATLSGHG